MALYGMQGMRKAVEFLFVVGLLYDQLKMITGSASLLQSLSTDDLASLSRYIVLTLHELRVELNDKYERWETINNLLANELIKRKSNSDPFFNPGISRSNAERRVLDIAKAAFKNSDVSISSNEYLCNMFEADILLRVPIANSIKNSQSDSCHLIINIEVDGIYHKQEKKKLFCLRRDRYLKFQGVIIDRIEVSTLRRIKDVEVEEWLLERVRVGQQNAEMRTLDDNITASTSLIISDDAINESSDLQILKRRKDDSPERSTQRQVFNPISKRMINIGGDTFRRLVKLGYTFTDDGRLVMNNT
jgi:hypothetical protein